MPEDKTGEERRSFKRLPKGVSLEVTKLKYPIPANPDEEARSSNISGGGTAFFSKKAYEPGFVLGLDIKIDDWSAYKKPFSRLSDISNPKENTLTAISEVVWCNKLEDGSGHEVGVKFVNIEKDDFEAFQKYLDDSA